MAGLSNPEKRLLKALQTRKGAWGLEEILAACEWSDQAIAVGAGQGLYDAGFARVDETVSVEWKLGEEGEKAVENGLLEARLWKWMNSVSEPSMSAMSEAFERHEAGPGVGLLKGLGVEIQGGMLSTENKIAIEAEIDRRSRFLNNLNDDTEMINHFKARKGLITSVENTTRTWSITEEGMEVSDLEEVEQIVEITPELLQTDSWRDAEFKPYNVNLESAMPESGRTHPMQALIERIRAIFLEMGFSELVDDYVQSAGWNMDALFIPQDHPAREMQDTFYLENPESIEIDSKQLAAWAAIHEHGGDTESLGWGGKFSNDIAKKGLLRTHTTVNTIQYLAKNPKQPCRMFTVDRVFRKESIDRTHLPEFHQIEGIIMEEGANLPMLVTTLKTFYAKMGCPDVRVRPAYFPYTEPSLEIEVKWKGKWLELGGAGIFRPEVCEPLGIEHPVLAWGMGLERLAMLVLGLDDIRQLYISDIQWLKSQPLL